jgi:hypothetical protein
MEEINKDPFPLPRLDLWDAAGENIVEHVAGIDDFEVATAAYRAALGRWPNSRVILRQGARTVNDSGPRFVIA